MSLFKYGSTIPVKVVVTDCDGSIPTDRSSHEPVAPADDERCHPDLAGVHLQPQAQDVESPQDHVEDDGDAGHRHGDADGARGADSHGDADLADNEAEPEPQQQPRRVSGKRDPHWQAWSGRHARLPISGA